MCNKSEKWHKEFTLLHDIERLTICHSLAIFLKKNFQGTHGIDCQKIWAFDPQVHDSPDSPGPPLVHVLNQMMMGYGHYVLL